MEGVNDTNLVLIPKKECQNPGNFRLIAFCNVAYKVVAMILTNRLRPLLDSIVSSYQAAFVPWRQILDNLVVAQELIRTWVKKSKRWKYLPWRLICQRRVIEWSGLFSSKLSTYLRLPNLFIKLIKACVCTTPQGQHQWRSWWILSPRERTVARVLSAPIFVHHMHGSFVYPPMWSKVVFKGLKVSHLAPSMSHLMFANDLMMLGVATIENLETAKHILGIFSNWYGQEIKYFGVEWRMI